MHRNTTLESHQVYLENTSASAQPPEDNIFFHLPWMANNQRTKTKQML